VTKLGSPGMNSMLRLNCIQFNAQVEDNWRRLIPIREDARMACNTFSELVLLHSITSNFLYCSKKKKKKTIFITRRECNRTFLMDHISTITKRKKKIVDSKVYKTI
jgi:hypothetical protein